MMTLEISPLEIWLVQQEDKELKQKMEQGPTAAAEAEQKPPASSGTNAGQQV